MELVSGIEKALDYAKSFLNCIGVGHGSFMPHISSPFSHRRSNKKVI